MIKLDNVTFSYGDEKIIQNLGISLAKDRIYCIMGASGIGKTTLLRLISGMLKCNSGSVSGTEKMKKSFIFQENRLLPEMSIYENLRFVTDDDKKINEALQNTELYDDKNKKASALSGGMARRVAIARAAAFDGDIFFIDEPLYGLDVKISENILELIRQTVQGKTAFIITHSPEEAFYLADEIIFLSDKPVTSAQVIKKENFSSAEGIKSYLLT